MISGPRESDSEFSVLTQLAKAREREAASAAEVTALRDKVASLLKMTLPPKPTPRLNAARLIQAAYRRSQWQRQVRGDWRVLLAAAKAQSASHLAEMAASSSSRMGLRLRLIRLMGQTSVDITAAQTQVTAEPRKPPCSL
jgi:hypothetical protein